MKYRMSSYAVAVATMVGVLTLGMVSESAAQNNTPAAKAAATAKKTPRTPDGRPDFSGFYNRDIYHGDPNQELAGQHFTNRASDGNIFYDYAGANEAQLHQAPAAEVANPAPYKPEYMAKVKQIQATTYGGTSALDPLMDCKPLGVPRGSTSIMQIVQRPEIIAIVYEANPGPAFRLIYLDGRKHPADLDTSYFGHSIGHWEGDTLVVDVVGLNDETWLGGGQGTANNALIHSDKEHVIERWTRNGDEITYQATVTDPVMFTRPWVVTKKAGIAHSDDYMQTQMCSHQDTYGNNSKAHFVQETEKDKFLCGWCAPEALYGIDSDKVTTGQNIPEPLKEALKTKVDELK